VASRDGGNNRRDRSRDKRRGERGGKKEKEKEKEREREKEKERPKEPKFEEPKGPPEGLTVTGCTHGTVGGIVRGEFMKNSENHNRPVYKKTEQTPGGLDVMLYFWDERDGEKFSGWWFGPKVGGDQVWAYHSAKDQIPPTSGWKVPYDGPVDDSFVVAAVSRSQESGGDKGDQGKQQDSRKKQADEQRKRMEEARKKQDEERQRVDHQKREEEAKKKAEEEAKRKAAEEARSKKSVEEIRRQEQKSTLAIRRVIQKVRLGTPDNFEELQKELKAVLDEELENTGSQKQRMMEESDKGLEQAKARIEAVNAARRAEQDRKDAEARAKLEAEAKARELVQELHGLVDQAEATANGLRELSEHLEADDLDSVQAVESAARGVEEASLASKTKTKACTDFILQRGSEMKDFTATSNPAQPSEQKLVLARLLQRINECSRTAEAATTSARGKKATAVRRAAARQSLKETEALFEKYDRDCDGKLSRREVAGYAKGEFKFVVPQATLDFIWKYHVFSDAGGVTLEGFQDTRISIGIARERERDMVRRKHRIEKEKLLKDMKTSLQEKVKKAAKVMEEADKDVQEAEKQVKPLQVKAKTMPADEMDSLADNVDASIKVAEASAKKARRRLDSVADSIDARFQEDLRPFLHSEAKLLEARMGRMDCRVVRTSNLSLRFRERAELKRTLELEKLRAAALKVIRHNQTVQKISRDELFDLVDWKRDGEIDTQEFADFIDSADKAMPCARPLRAGKLGGSVPLAASPKSAALAPLMAATPKAFAKAPPMASAPPAPEASEDPADVEAKAEGGEAADGQPAEPAAEEADAEGPRPELIYEKVEISREAATRVFTFLLEDGQNTIDKETFLRLMRLFFKVRQATVLTDCHSIKGSTIVRRLEPGEVVEVLQGPMVEESVGLMRVQAKAMNDGTEGWITISGNQGTVFLEEGGGLFRVLKETILTEDFNLTAGKDTSRKLKDLTRKVREGEILEVWEWPLKEEESGLTRMRAKVKSDGAVGWVTTLGNQGAVFAEIV